MTEILLSGHQPEFWPWLGYFHKIHIADKFMIVDHVNFQPKNYQDRIQLRCNHGSTHIHWLHVPIQQAESKNQTTPINQIKISNDTRKNWKIEHLQYIQTFYKKSKFFNEVFPFVMAIYKNEYQTLSELNTTIIINLCKKLNISTPIYLSSDYHFKNQKTELLAEMCERLACTGYISGTGAKDYFQPEIFKNKNLVHFYRKLDSFEYITHWKPFVAGMSILDCLFNIGFENTERLIKNLEYDLEE